MSELPLTESFASKAALEGTRLRLRTLIRLRWIAIAGQSAAVLFVYTGLGFELPLAACFAVIALSAVLNLYLRLRKPPGRDLSTNAATALLTYDVLQLALLLALTGGLTNPFSVLLVVPVVVSATALPTRSTIFLVLLTLTVTTAISWFHLPLPWHSEGLVLPGLYTAGIWVALASALAFMSFYAFRVAEESRQMSEALAAAELVLAREQHLSAIDGLAAAAAHELGTPLATIALVARELERDIPDGSPHAEDVKLLRSQVERCRGILERVGSLGNTQDSPLDRVPLTNLIEEIAEPHREFGIAIAVTSEGESPEPVTRRNPAVLYGLGNLVENAVDFARSSVTVHAKWDAGTVTVEVIDDGPGFSQEILTQIGEPYLTTRGRRRGSQAEAGLGLGLFIAKTLLERSSARLHIANRGRKRGAVAQVIWPRVNLEAEQPQPSQTLADPAENANTTNERREAGASVAAS